MYISLPKDQTLRTSMASKQKVRHVGSIFTSFNPWSTEAHLSFFKLPTMAQFLISGVSWMLRALGSIGGADSLGQPNASCTFGFLLSLFFLKHLSTISTLNSILFCFVLFFKCHADNTRCQEGSPTLDRMITRHRMIIIWEVFWGECRLLAWFTSTDVRPEFSFCCTQMWMLGWLQR